MRDRLIRWLGALAAMTALTVALLAGAATAAADPGSEPSAGNDKPAAAGQQDSPTSTSDEGVPHHPRPAGGDETRGAASGHDVEPASEADKSGTAKKKARAARLSVVRSVGTVQRDIASRQEHPDDPPTQQKPAVPTSTAAVTERAADTALAQAAAPRRATPLDAVGSAVLNVVMGLIQFFAGPPVLPADAHVTVRTSTLRIPVAGGRTVTADWYFPDTDEPPTRLIYLQHGFGAVGSMYSHTAAALAERTHSVVVAPTITSNFLVSDGAWLAGAPMQQAIADLFAGNRDALTASAAAAAGHDVVLPTRFALVGHSAGGSLVMGAAAGMTENGAIADLTGIVLLDSVDMNGTVPHALSVLTGANYRPVMDISSERYVWNMFGAVGDELEDARPGQFNGVMLTGGRHIDGLSGGNPVIQAAEYLIAGVSAPKNVAAVQTVATGWINDLFAGTREGYYPAPREVIDIPTVKGTATAVGLPFTWTKHIQATPWDKVSEVILTWIARVAHYDSDSGSVVALKD
ncbi:alpha/beta hydrolase [Mycolicibacterium sp. Y3]